METIKTSPNVEFDVIYADGTRKRVSEGVLIEADGDGLIFHNGTDRPEVVLAACEALAEIIADIAPEKLKLIFVSRLIKIMKPAPTEASKRSAADKDGG